MKEQIKVIGGKLLKGNVEIDGSKNLVVSLIPASLLCKGIVKLYNVPLISDVELLIKILGKLNVKTSYENKTLTIDSSNIKYIDLLDDDVRSFRASYYFMGVMLGLFSHLKIYHPGGCNFGKRPINYHLDAFKEFGVSFNEDEIIDLEIKDFKDTTINFKESSVGASINIILLAAYIEVETKINNVALEPEVSELLKFLSLMGVEIKGIGTRNIIIKGNKNLIGCEFEVIPDRIEAGTYALLGATCGENITIYPFVKEHLESLFNIFNLLEVPYTYKNKSLTISKCNSSKGILIETSPYPGFPTDLQQPLTTFLSQINATSVVIENIYQERFAHIPMLNKMGANIIRNNNMIIIHGVNKLIGSEVDGKDLRGGASLVIASLSAEGESLVNGFKFINRGYVGIIDKVKKLGADITLIRKE